MKYSENIITDENMDEEIEKLQDYKSNEYTMFGYSEFREDGLPAGFDMHVNDDGIEEWTEQKIHEGYTEGRLAFEFANGFLIMTVGGAM